MRSLGIITGLMIGLVVAFFLIRQTISYQAERQAIDELIAKEVDHLVVYEGDWPRDEPRTVYDRDKIIRIVDSLRAGKKYSASHDRQNGFERYIVIEPQGIEVSIYQKIGDDESVIVNLGDWDSDGSSTHYGSIRCRPPGIWKDL